ncbi:hypothetical protein J6590_055008 [Homalodisca vitripennis]|nr:hypothetical protein J6590_055008 [Homalodisca vitripennis]
MPTVHERIIHHTPRPSPTCHDISSETSPYSRNYLLALLVKSREARPTATCYCVLTHHEHPSHTKPPYTRAAPVQHLVATSLVPVSTLEPNLPAADSTTLGGHFTCTGSNTRAQFTSRGQVLQHLVATSLAPVPTLEPNLPAADRSVMLQYSSDTWVHQYNTWWPLHLSDMLQYSSDTWVHQYNTVATSAPVPTLEPNLPAADSTTLGGHFTCTGSNTRAQFTSRGQVLQHLVATSLAPVSTLEPNLPAADRSVMLQYSSDTWVHQYNTWWPLHLYRFQH